MLEPGDKAKWIDTDRDNKNRIISIVALIFGLISLIVAIFLGSKIPNLWKYLIVGFWILVPPIYFWYDWHFLCKDIPKDKSDSVKHSHDLSRNIWVALVVVLIALFDIGIFKP